MENADLFVYSNMIIHIQNHSPLPKETVCCSLLSPILHDVSNKVSSAHRILQFGRHHLQ